jgi:hypothetical protein
MILHIIVGSTGSGKTFCAKKFIAQYPNICVYDIQNEYGLPFLNETSDKKRFKTIDIKQFVGFTKKLKGYCFLIEEATGVFDGKIGMDFTQAILSKRHTHNRFVLIFHTLNTVPKKLYGFCDYLTLFKTNDLEMDVKKKFPNLLSDWKNLKNSPKYSRKFYKNTDLALENRL